MAQINNDIKSVALDVTQVIGLGSFGLKDRNEWQIVNVNIKHLETVIKSLKSLDKEMGIDICIANDSPLVIGKFDKQTNRVGGFAIAPRILQG